MKQAMRNETEMYFSNIVHEDRNIIELIESDYTFVNSNLARAYGLTNMNIRSGNLQKVILPPDSPRGGVLTEGTVLTVTSHPDRTSPVKRGLFVLNNFLGTPVAPPPPNIPALEIAEKGIKDHPPTLRESLELHREDPLCASCHARMDPIGLGLENFNALGVWRDKERGQPIDTAGKLITGETFNSVQELKHILATKHKTDFYRCLTEKLLTYALGRGVEYYDTETVDKIVHRLESENGRFGALVEGIVDSAPFQEQRNVANAVLTQNEAARQPRQRHASGQPQGITMNKNNGTSSNQHDLATERRLSLSRRRFLRGLGACMALPAFESFKPLQLLGAPSGAVADGQTAPVRMAFLQVPNGIIPGSFWPTGEAGPDFELSPTLQPLAKVRHELQVISGLDDLSANAGGDGGGDHARAGGTFLTGVRIKKTAGADIYGGVSIDQVVARKIGHLTRFSSLELACDAVRKSGDCDSGYACAYEYNMAWRSPTQPVTPETNPRLVFERLFGAGSPSQRSANLKLRQAEQHSILDFVMQDANSLGAKMNGRDRQKLDPIL